LRATERGFRPAGVDYYTGAVKVAGGLLVIIGLAIFFTNTPACYRGTPNCVCGESCNIWTNLSTVGFLLSALGVVVYAIGNSMWLYRFAYGRN